MTHDDELRSRFERLASTHELGELSADDVTARRGRGTTWRRAVVGAAVLILVVAVAGVVRLVNDDPGADTDVASGIAESTADDTADDTADEAAGVTTTRAPAAETLSSDDSIATMSSYGGSDWVLPWGDGFVSFGRVFEPSDVTMVDLVPDIADRLPAEVVEALGDITDIDEATALLDEVGLLDEATSAVVNDPELFDAWNQVVAGGTSRPEASLSADGETWTVLDDFAMPNNSDYVNLAQSDGEHLVVVEQVWDDGDGAGAIVVSMTDDLVEWDSVTVPVRASDVPDYVQSDTYANALALGADGWYLTVFTSSWLDAWALIPAEIQAEYQDGFGWSAEAEGLRIDTYELDVYEASSFGVTTTVGPIEEPSVEPGESVESRIVPWSELGITYADYQRYSGETPGAAAAFTGTWDGAIAEATPPARGDCCAVIGTDSGFIAQTWGGWDGSDEPVGQRLLFSVDGDRWVEFDGPPGGELLNGLIAVDGGVVGSDSAGAVWRAAPDGTGWEAVDIPGLPDTANLWFGQQSGRGTASVIDVATYDYEYAALPYVVVIEQDGYEIRSDTGSDGSVAIRVTELATGTIVLEEVIDPLRSSIPDFVRYDSETSDTIQLLDADGEVIVAVPMATFDEATMLAVEEARAESGWVEPEYDYTPDFWLVASADGINWYVEDLDDSVEDSGFGQAAVNGDTVVIRAWNGEWERFSIS